MKYFWNQIQPRLQYFRVSAFKDSGVTFLVLYKPLDVSVCQNPFIKCKLCKKITIFIYVKYRTARKEFLSDKQKILIENVQKKFKIEATFITM
jgi:hypothetical protein